MPQITAIKKQKRAGRANIFLDGKFAFGIDLETLFKENLAVEQELTIKDIARIKKTGDYQKTYGKLLNYATIRPRSEKEISLWFRKHKVDEKIHEKLISKLKKLELLDDIKFARWWVDQRQSFRPKSKRVLSLELYQKGIAKQIINDTLEDTEIDELSLAKNLVEKNKYKWERFEDKVRKQKCGK